MRVVAIGGGHGLAASIRALRRLDAAAVPPSDDVPPDVAKAGTKAAKTNGAVANGLVGGVDLAGGVDLTAVVSVADDGASSGRIRAELGVLPPGDLRKTLVAMAGDDPEAADTAELFEHRLGGSGPLAGHAVGNLILSGLLERHTDAATALAAAARMVSARGDVLPAAQQPLVLDGDVVTPGSAEPVRVRGQAQLVSTRGRLKRLRIEPVDARACPDSVRAIHAADAVVIGPGSWFTSVLAPLLVPEIAAAVASTSARVVLVLNLATGPGETAGMTAAEHVETLAEHLPELRCDAIIADPSVVDGPDDRAGVRGADVQDSDVRDSDVPDGAGVRDGAGVQGSDITGGAGVQPGAAGAGRENGKSGSRHGHGGGRLAGAAQSLGGRLVRAPVAMPGGTPRHDEVLLAGALRSVFGRWSDSWKPAERSELSMGGSTGEGSGGTSARRSELALDVSRRH